MRIRFLIAHVLFPLLCFAQQGNSWCFGDSAGLNFNSGGPAPFFSSINSGEASASISDENGNLLFSAGGDEESSTVNVWDKHNNLMQNGNGIIGGASSTNGLLIIPCPGNASRYYLFSSNSTALYVNIIDINMNGGSGSVTQRDVLISDTLYTGEKLTAIKHANGRDWWLITHYADYSFTHPPNNLFVKYLITPEGISPPILQSIGTLLYGWGGYYGEMESTMAGDRIVFSGFTYTTLQATQPEAVIDVIDFDRCTGQLFNFIPLGASFPVTTGGPYGSSFSPNGKVLYVSSSDRLYQYDLQSSNIEASRFLLWTYWNSSHAIGQQQLAPDGKIYIAVLYGLNLPNDTFYDTANMYLTVINDPDVVGSGCTVAPFSAYLGGARSYLGLPNMPNYNLGKITGGLCDTIIIPTPPDYSFNLFPNPSDGHFHIVGDFPIGTRLHIYDLLGQEVTESISILDGNQQISISVNLAQGIYIYRVVSDKEILYQGEFSVIK